MKKYFILAAVAATFAACSFDKDMGESSSQVLEEQVPIALASSFNITPSSVVTRSNATSVQRTSLVENIGVYIYKSTMLKTDNGYGYANINFGLPTNITSTSYYSVSTSSQVTYPDAKQQKVDVYAYAPYFDTSTSAPSDGITALTNSGSLNDGTNKATISYTTPSDQTTAAKYQKADLLYGYNKNTSIANSTTATTYELTAEKSKSCTTTNTLDAYGFIDKKIYLPMIHKLSKITLKISPDGMGVDKLEEATVKIYVDKIGNSFTLDDGNFGTAIGATDGTNGDAIILTNKLGYVDDGSTKYGTSDTSGDGVIHDGSTISGYTASGIVVPQSFPTSHPFLTITLSDNVTSYSWKNTTLSSLSFESGKEYVFNITVKASGLSVAVEVVNWESTTDNDGEAVLD